jgi:hypothetical protein
MQSGGSRLYGVNAHLYYFIEAYPVMLLSLLPFVCMGAAPITLSLIPHLHAPLATSLPHPSGPPSPQCVLLTLTRVGLVGIAWASGTHQRRPAQLVAVVTIVYSLTAHKE